MINRSKRAFHRIAPDTYDRLSSISSYRAFFHRFPNLVTPRRFSDKLIYKRVFGNPNDPFLVTTADKWAVRDYVANIVGSDILSDVYFVTSDVDSISFDNVRFPVVLKSTHGNGHIMILRDEEEASDPEVYQTCRSWLKQTFPLWYRRIQPQIMAEEFLGGPVHSDEPLRYVPPDYKFYVFSGAVEIITAHLDRFNGHLRSVYSRNWSLLDVRYQFAKISPMSRPANLDQMIAIAEKLGAGCEFVRIDLYDLGDRVVFGEMTHSPQAGRIHFDPPSFDEWLGSRWRR